MYTQVDTASLFFFISNIQKLLFANISKKAVIHFLKEFLLHLRSHPRVPFRVGSPTISEGSFVNINCLNTRVRKLPLAVVL